MMARAYRRVEQDWCRWRFRRNGVTFGNHVQLRGRPIIERVDDSTIHIADGVVLTSLSSRTPLGVNHPVIIRTLLPGAEIVIGEDCGISGGVICAARRVIIGSGALLGANTTIIDTDFHPVHAKLRRHLPMPTPRASDEVVIGENVFIGTGAIVLKGVHIGHDAVVAAGAVVVGDVAAGSTVGGNPARQIR